MAELRFQQAQIRDVADINANSIKIGQAPSQIDYIDISSVGTGEFLEPPKRLPFNEAPSRARRIVRAGDTIRSTVRPNRRSFLFLADPGPLAVASTGFAVLTPTSKVDARYLYYWVTREEFTDYLSLHAKGAAYPAVSPDDIGGGAIDLPSLPLQRRIAGILQAYDALIENSHRRIGLLEAITRALYREWFVHFRYPGHKDHPCVPSPIGDIPKGWEVKKLATVAAVNRAQINARIAPEELHYIDISSVSPGQIDSMKTYAFADAPGRARRVVQHGDVLWSCVRPNRRSHAQVIHPEPNTIASTGFAVLTATKVPFTFLYAATTTDDFVAFLTNNATGAAYPAVSGATFENADQLIPPATLLKKFGDATIPMAEQIHALRRQIQNLRRTRDLLLPRLLSGQIDVEAIAS